MIPGEKKGFALAEVLIASTLISVFIAALVGAHSAYMQVGSAGPSRAKALYLASQSIEGLKFGRDESWSAQVESAVFAPEYIDGFLREVSLADAGGQAKHVAVSVSWSDRGATSTVSLETLIFNLYDN